MTRVERWKSLLHQVAEVDAELRSFDHVHHVDVGFRYVDGVRTEALTARAFIHGPKYKPAKSRNLVPRRFRGLPTDVISSSFKRHCESPLEPARVGVAPTIVGGVSIARDGGGAGTAGMVVRSSRFSGLLVLTCNHVAGAHEQVFQPGQHDSSAARLVGETCAISFPDLASLVRIHGVSAEKGVVLGLPPITGVVSEEALLALCARHSVVQKSGRSTGVTAGELDGVGPTGTVSIVNLVNSSQPEVACPGDSGAIWMTGQGKAVAMHFAGEPWRGAGQAMYLIARNLALVFDD
jgi:hypothetical protein